MTTTEKDAKTMSIFVIFLSMTSIIHYIIIFDLKISFLGRAFCLTCASDDSSSTSMPYLGSSPPLLAPSCRRRTPEIEAMIPACRVDVFSASASSILNNGRSISVCLSVNTMHTSLCSVRKDANMCNRCVDVITKC